MLLFKDGAPLSPERLAAGKRILVQMKRSEQQQADNAEVARITQSAVQTGQGVTDLVASARSVPIFGETAVDVGVYVGQQVTGSTYANTGVEMVTPGQAAGGLATGLRNADSGKDKSEKKRSLGGRVFGMVQDYIKDKAFDYAKEQGGLALDEAVGATRGPGVDPLLTPPAAPVVAAAPPRPTLGLDMGPRNDVDGRVYIVTTPRNQRRFNGLTYVYDNGKPVEMLAVQKDVVVHGTPLPNGAVLVDKLEKRDPSTGRGGIYVPVEPFVYDPSQPDAMQRLTGVIESKAAELNAGFALKRMMKVGENEYQLVYEPSDQRAFGGTAQDPAEILLHATRNPDGTFTVRENSGAENRRAAANQFGMPGEAGVYANMPPGFTFNPLQTDGQMALASVLNERQGQLHRDVPKRLAQRRAAEEAANAAGALVAGNAVQSYEAVRQAEDERIAAAERAAAERAAAEMASMLAGNAVGNVLNALDTGSARVASDTDGLAVSKSGPPVDGDAKPAPVVSAKDVMARDGVQEGPVQIAYTENLPPMQPQVNVGGRIVYNSRVAEWNTGYQSFLTNRDTYVGDMQNATDTFTVSATGRVYLDGNAAMTNDQDGNRRTIVNNSPELVLMFSPEELERLKVEKKDGKISLS
ncbi:MAG: hypothetical protein K2Q01_03270, partial [Rickettsiales bacterium]|nr:hypothetical protein [Rickettsiales bacterium]